MDLSLRQLFSLGLVIFCGIVGLSAVAYADQPLQSTNYQIDESTLGGGGLVNSSSTNYNVNSTLGSTAVGNTQSTNYQSNTGYQTTANPALTLNVKSPSGGFTPDFSPAAPSTNTSTFSVVDYTSYGYDVLITGTPPTYDGHTIPAMTTNGPGTAGTEQFGINVVANSQADGQLVSFGANPNYGQFGATSAGPTTNYGTANSYRYVDGEAIVSSPKSSGKITYTISYLVNVQPLTPGGSYTSNLDLICIATY